MDEEGHKEIFFEEIIDHRSNQDTIKCSDGKNQFKTTNGWDLYVQWKGGQTTWVALKDMKNGFPVQTANYTIKKGLEREPAFAWWVPYVLRKAIRIISKIKSKYW